MRNVFKVLGVIAIVAIIGFSFNACGGDEEGGETVEFLSVSANGSATQSTTQLTLTFDKDVYCSLTDAGIRLSGIAGVVKGTLTGPEKGTVFTLPISGFTQGGTLTVDVTWVGGEITVKGSPKTVTIFYNGGGFNFQAVADSKFGTSNVRGIAYGGGKFVAVGASGKAAYSTDGVNWTLSGDTKITGWINCIAYGGNKFVAGGDDGIMSYSTDGIAWTKVTNSGFKLRKRAKTSSKLLTAAESL